MRMRLSYLLAGCACAVAAVLLLTSSNQLTLRATFANVDGLRVGDDVVIRGVRSGTVASLSLQADDAIVAGFHLDAGSVPIGRGARAVVASQDLLGTKVVELSPGDPREPLRPGAMLGESQTSTATDLDQVLAVLTPDTRARLQILIDGLGLALTGRGDDFARLLAALPRSLDRTRELLAAFTGGNNELSRLVASSDQLLVSIAAQRGPLGSLVDSAEGALRVTAARQQQLAQTIAQAPSTVAQLRSSLVSLQRAAGPLGPAAQALQATAPRLTAVLRQLPAVRGVATATLGTATRVAPDLSSLAQAATPLIRALKPTAARLDRFATALGPVSSTLDSGATNILGTLEGWARAIQKRDGVGHVFRGELNLSPEIATSLINEFVLGPPVGARGRSSRHGSRPAPAPSVAPRASGPGASPTQPSPATPGEPLIPVLGSTLAKTAAGATSGLSSLLGYLLKP